MPTFEIQGPDGRTYEVDAPDMQSAAGAFSQYTGGSQQPPQGAPQQANGGFTSAPASPPAPPPDKYQQAAQAKMQQLKGTPADPSYGPAEQFINGRMFGALPTAMGVLTTPFAMAEHGTWNPVEGYNYAKAQQNAEMNSGNQKWGGWNTAANIAGGAMTGSDLAAAGITAVPKQGGLLMTGLGMGADGAGYGAATGLASGEGMDRFTDAAKGAATGFGLGAALPVGAKVLSWPFAKIAANIASRVNPEGAAKASLARALAESGQTPEQLQLAVDNAAAAGQPEYSLMDALGRPGASMASNVARSPGEGATEMAQFLQARQNAQGGNLIDTVNEGLNTSGTADQLKNALIKARSTVADTNYGAARDAAGALDVSPVLDQIDKNLTPGVNRIVDPNSDLAGLPIDSKMQWIRDRLGTDTNQLSDFSRGFQVKREIDSTIEKLSRQGDNTSVRALTPIRDQLDNQLALASEPYANARDTFRKMSQPIEAVDTGAQAAKSGRYADTIPAYNALDNPSQAAYRAGYADTLAGKIEKGTQNSNKALNLMNDKAQNELSNMSQYQGPLQPGQTDQLGQSIARSNAMNETANRALRGSHTFDNMQNEEGMALDPGVLFEAGKGNIHGLALDLIRKGVNAVNGSTPEVRQILGQALMERGPNADIVGKFGPLVEQYAKAKATLRGGISGLSGNLAGPSQSSTAPQGR